ELLQSNDWEEARTKSKVPLALGKDVYGKTIIADLAQMPHLLVAGTTGSGKSVCINALVASMIFRFTPEELRFIMIDPKVVEMQMYNALPHLAFPVVTDPKKVLLALRWVIDEMEKRYKIFAQAGVRNITSFNGRPAKKTQKELDEDAGMSPAHGKAADTAAATESEIKVPREDELVIPDRMPYIVIIIDELADLMQTAPADVESAIARITQMARAAGIHLIVAAQTPPSFDLAMQDKLQLSSASAEEVTDEDEELVEKCLEIIRQEKRASTSLLQRRLRLGYTRAARIVDILEQRGILGPGEGAKPREILVDLDAAV